MPTGLVVLFAVALLVYFGLAHRVLDRMRLSDAQALAFLGLMVIGSFIDLPLVRGRVSVSVNAGGALVPLALAIYLLSRADSTGERVRAVVAAAATALAIRALGSLTTFDPPQTNLIDPLWLSALVGGVMGYLAGRSRRASFIAGTLGVVLADVAHAVQAAVQGFRSDVSIGGAGVFDTVVIAGVLAVAFAELFGEVRERLQGGPEISEERPEALFTDGGPPPGDATRGGGRREGERDE